MYERQFNQLFAENLNYYLDKNQISQRELARNLGVSSTKVLFDASRNVSEEDILNVSKILQSMKKDERP